MLLLMPRPQPQVPNRIGIGAPLANAVPLVLRKKSNIGRLTATAAPFNIPRSTRRRLKVFMVTSETSLGGSGRRGRQTGRFRRRRSLGRCVGDLRERGAQ